MKKLILILAIMIIIVAPAFAEDRETTGRGQYVTPWPGITDDLNSNPYIYHKHKLEPVDKFQKGYGLDVVTYESAEKNVQSTVEYRYNVDTRVHSVFSVMKVNVFQLVRNFFD